MLQEIIQVIINYLFLSNLFVNWEQMEPSYGIQVHQYSLWALIFWNLVLNKKCQTFYFKIILNF